MQDFKNGKLKITDCKNFMTALKSCWIRRFIFAQSDCTELFQTQLGYSLQTIINCGRNFIDIFIINQPIPSGSMYSLAGKR